MASQGEKRGSTYRYEFKEGIPLEDAKEALLLAVMAAESLHGRSRVQLDASFRLDEATRICVVNASTDVGRDIARIFTGYLTREFGEGAFQVERTSAGITEGEGKSAKERSS